MIHATGNPCPGKKTFINRFSFARSTFNIFFIAFEFMAIIQLCEKVGREK
jgi:hypothetical protein